MVNYIHINANTVTINGYTNERQLDNRGSKALQIRYGDLL